MRWLSYFDAVHGLYGGFKKTKPALDSVSADTEQEVNTRQEAEGLSKKIVNRETIFPQFFGMTFLKVSTKQVRSSSQRM